jgi:predicted glycosyltransferase
MRERRILIDICHPAEVHHFKFLYRELSDKGWTFLFAAKKKDVTEALLAAYGLPYILFSESKRGFVRKILHLPHDLWRFYRIVRRFRPTFLFSNLSLHSSWIGAICPVTHVAFIDTEHRRFLDYFTLPFAQVKLTPQAYRRQLGQNHLRYRGNHELSYVHPQRFQPHADVRQRLGLEPGESFVVLRFIAWQAFHDVGLHGMSSELKLELVRELSKARRVFISSEGALPLALRQYQLTTSPEQIHDVLYYADAYIGEGGTMASEAVCLGTPAVYINALELGYCQDEARAGLLTHIPTLTRDAIKDIVAISKTKAFRAKWEIFMDDQIDVTSFMVRFIKRFPQSLREHKLHLNSDVSITI